MSVLVDPVEAPQGRPADRAGPGRAGPGRAEPPDAADRTPGGAAVPAAG
jgi:hypothetical protein